MHSSFKSRGHTYAATSLRPLPDQHFLPITEVATRSPSCPGEAAEKSATSRELTATKLVAARFFNIFKYLAVTYLIADSPPPHFFRIGACWLLLKLVGD